MLKLLTRLILLAIVAAAAVVGWLAWFAHQPLKLERTPVEFTIQPGSALRSAIRQMTASGIAMPEWAFFAIARTLGKAGEIKAGSYELAAGATPLDLLGKITRGEFVQVDIVFIEGWTFKQMRDALDAHPHVRHDTRGLSEADVMRRVQAPGDRAEGLFFPDTYHFPKGSSDVDILRRAYQAMERRLNAAWSERDPGLPLASPYEALILASIVEKETGQKADRNLIAAVFINRLRGGIRLQTDPTVIYGLGERFDGNLRKRDLLADTPFNTYTRDGLPPTPIAMPGLASIEAVMRPARTDALYFVARGDGTSEFSRTLDDHNRAVNKYQRRGR